MIVADSDVLIDALAGREPSKSQIEEALLRGNLATTAISLFELESGVRSPAASEAVHALCHALPVYVVDSDAAREAARVRRDLEAQGTPIGMAAYLIAGVCLSRGARLLTRNIAHFGRVANLALVEG